jgi:hypothetical protein
LLEEKEARSKDCTIKIGRALGIWFQAQKSKLVISDNNSFKNILQEHRLIYPDLDCAWELLNSSPAFCLKRVQAKMSPTAQKSP